MIWRWVLSVIFTFSRDVWLAIWNKDLDWKGYRIKKEPIRLYQFKKRENRL
jgi:hypothetical protein